MPVETKTKLVKIDAIQANDWNPNIVPDDIMASIIANIEANGQLQSITCREVNPDGETTPGSGVFEVIDGEHRWKAAREVGHKQIWVTLSEMTREQAKAQTLAMNKLRGAMDPAGVAQVFKDLADFGTDLGDVSLLTGYSLDEITAAIKLLDFDWPKAPEPGEREEEWHTFVCRMPAEVWALVEPELQRLKSAMQTDADFRPLEYLFVESSQVTDKELASRFF